MALGNLSKKNEKSIYDSICSNVPLDIRPMKSELIGNIGKLDDPNHKVTEDFDSSNYNADDNSIYFTSVDVNNSNGLNVKIYKYDLNLNQMILEFEKLFNTGHTANSVNMASQKKQSQIFKNKLYFFLDEYHYQYGGEFNNHYLYYSYLYEYDIKNKDLQKIIDMPIYDHGTEQIPYWNAQGLSILLPAVNDKFIAIVADKIYKIDPKNKTYESVMRFKHFKTPNIIAPVYGSTLITDKYFVVLLSNYLKPKVYYNTCVVFDKNTGNLVKEYFPVNNQLHSNIVSSYKGNLIFCYISGTDPVKIIVDTFRGTKDAINKNKVFEAEEAYNFNCNLVSIGNDEFILFTNSNVYRLIPPNN